MDIRNIQWKNDFVTRAFIREHGEDITDVETMTASDLATTLTYCKTVDNPYAKELVNRTGALSDFNCARSLEEKNNILRTECKKFGIQLF